MTLTPVSGHSKYFGDGDEPVHPYTITPLDQDTNYTLDDKNPEQITDAIFKKTYNGTDQKPEDKEFSGKVKYNGTYQRLKACFIRDFRFSVLISSMKFCSSWHQNWHQKSYHLEKLQAPQLCHARTVCR